MPFSHSNRVAAPGGDQENLVAGALAQAGRVGGGFVRVLEVSSPNVRDKVPTRYKSDIADVESVVSRIMRQPTGVASAPGPDRRQPHIANTKRTIDPRDGLSVLRSGEIAGKRSADDLLDGKTIGGQRV